MNSACDSPRLVGMIMELVRQKVFGVYLGCISLPSLCAKMAEMLGNPTPVAGSGFEDAEICRKLSN